jgi:5-hydroxyisourate hydrolase
MHRKPTMKHSFLLRGATALALVVVSALAWGQAAGGRVTAHVLDLYTGTPASGMRIDFLAVDGGTTKVLKTLTTNVDGRPPEGPLLTPDTIKAGRYQAVLYIGEYYQRIGAKLPDKFHTRLILEFDVTNAAQPHHLPFQITPWTQSASVLPG